MPYIWFNCCKGSHELNLYFLLITYIEQSTFLVLSVLYANTVEPVYNGPVLSGHPLLSGQFIKSRFFAHINAVFVTCIRRPPQLSGRGRGHPVAVPCLSFFVIITCIKRPPLNGKAICTVPWITGIVAGSADSQRLALQTKVSNSEVPKESL